MNSVNLHLASALLLLVVQSSVAANANIAEGVEACRRERDDAQRLACFDRVAAEMAKMATAERQRTIAVAGSVPRPDKIADENFGLEGSELARKRDTEKEGQGLTPTRLAATVTAISKRPRGELIFTLDNGQVWAQKDPESYFPINVGDSVTILAGTLGSFRLIVSKRSTRVTRVQ